MIEAQTNDVENIITIGEIDTFILLETITRQFEVKKRLLDLREAELDAAITVHKILGLEHQLNPSPIIREIHTDTLGGVQ